MKFVILYHPTVVKVDIPKLSSSWRAKIKSAIEEKFTLHPHIYGKPLRKSLFGYRKLRVGDYRVIFKIETKIERSVFILAIMHRSVIYQKVNKRT